MECPEKDAQLPSTMSWVLDLESWSPVLSASLPL